MEKTTPIWGILLLTILLQFMVSQPVLGNKYSVEAFDIATGKPGYTEKYHEHWEGGKLVEANVTYRTPDGKVAARKVVTFHQDLSKPDYQFDDQRDGYLKGVKAEGNKFKIFYRLTSQEPVKETLISIPEPVVLDLGIHYFILKNWDKLMANNKKTFNFVVPKKLDFFKLSVTKIKEFQLNQKQMVQFEIKPNNFFVGLVAGVVGQGSNTMTYDKQTKKVMYYQGVSAIHDDKGASYEVKSNYHYPK